jgi:cytochrome c-type biogenesis protein CcmH
MATGARDKDGGWGMGRLLLIVAIVIALVSVGYAVTRGTGTPAGEAASLPGDTAGPATARPSGPEDAIHALQDRVGADPNDAEGWRQLGAAYFDGQRYADAARAYRRASTLSPGEAGLWSALGEALVMASDHDPMPAEAARAFGKAVALDPKDPRGRYFMAVRRDLAGEHEGAVADWLALLADTPPGAPWERDLRRTIAQVGRINNIDVAPRLAAIRQPAPHPDIAAPSVATAAIPGPTQAQMQAAAGLPKGAQDQMIEGMVSSLEAKLRADPGNVEGWIMLMRSRMTLGETAKASAAYRSAAAANPAQAGRIRDEARILGVPGA